MQATLKSEMVEKENISSLPFNSRETVDQHPELLNQIKAATKLGNAFRGKVHIYFRDDNSLKCVNTTLWAHGSKYVCLKGGVWIPISRIVEIKY
jgi:hypothetical protein